MRVELPLIELRHRGHQPLYEQLYLALREHMLTGRLKPASRLASTRRLAEHLGVSRFTIVTALERLHAEGYLTTRAGSGTYVADTLPDVSMRPAPGPSRRQRGNTVRPTLAQRGQSLAAIWTTGPRPEEPRAFQPRRAPLDQFPVRAWSAIVRRLWRRGGYRLLEYGDPAGHEPLREAIAAHISVTRAVQCRPEQVIITSGSQQAFDVLFRLLLDPGDRAWIEEPGPLDARAALLAAGAQLVPVPVDEDGINVTAGLAVAPDARLVMVSPSHQYPAGVTLSATRRLELVQWAERAGVWVVEDDYDSYFRFAGRPMSALQGVVAGADPSSHIIYVGSFSKTMFPALRIGFCIVPAGLARVVANARAVADRHSPVVDQAALAEFMVSGHYERHLRRLRVLCQERHQAMHAHFSRVFGDRITLSPVSAGTHVVGWLKESPRPNGGNLAIHISRMAEEEGLVVFPLSRYCLAPPNRDALILGFGGLSPRRIGTGAEKLASIVEAVDRIKSRRSL